VRNALAGNLSPSLTACNTSPRRPCIWWLIGTLLLLAFWPQVFIWELICRWPLGYWPAINPLDDLLPDLSVTRSTCHSTSGPRDCLLLTSSTTDDRPDHSPIWENFCTQNIKSALERLKPSFYRRRTGQEFTRSLQRKLFKVALQLFHF